MSWDDELVTVDRFLYIGDAEMARATLEGSGIDAVLINEFGVRFGENPSSGIWLQVRRRDYERAAELLRGEEIESPPEPVRGVGPSHLPTCRRCGSEEIYPIPSRRTIVLRATAAVLLTVFLPVPHVIVMAVLIAAILYVAWNVLLPRMHCRNSRAEWRARQRTA